MKSGKCFDDILRKIFAIWQEEADPAQRLLFRTYTCCKLIKKKVLTNLSNSLLIV